MLGLLVVTHGGLAEQLVGAAKRILGSDRGMVALSIDWDDDVERAQRSIAEAVERVDDGDGVLILTDMFGGTPTNLTLPLLDVGQIEIVTGVNLPMLIKYANHRDHYTLAEAAREIAEQGRAAIHCASGLLASEAASETDA